ncbi:helix-turn-helix domain-containing protein [Sphingomonas paeninsulae]|nr:helix-turn-helix domain-containing protein [Sphingomonas paeninsulae]
MAYALTVKTLAEKWGCSMSFVYSEIDKGRLTVMRLGPKLIRIRPDDVEAYEAAALVTADIFPEPLATPHTIAGNERVLQCLKDMRTTARLLRAVRGTTPSPT